MFVPSNTAMKEMDRFLRKNYKAKIEIVSFEEGLQLVQQENCCGGSYELKTLSSILKIMKRSLN